MPASVAWGSDIDRPYWIGFEEPSVVSLKRWAALSVWFSEIPVEKQSDIWNCLSLPLPDHP
ncbi:MAG: hypothetical protein E5V94_13760 [Mesorhizobium sp.]|nr:MAG: hypothetical protein E5V94_13760 [Mesorhizobium sp.]